MGYYLDPALTKRRCDSYRSHLEKDNQSITTVRNAVNSFLDEGILNRCLLAVSKNICLTIRPYWTHWSMQMMRIYLTVNP